MIVREMLARGDFNNMSQAHQADGSVIVMLTKHDDPHRYIMLVRDLYQSTELVVWERVEGD